MSVQLALYQPDIPQNTGAVIRLCACFGARLHLIHPFGFAFSDKKLRRAGMDYVAHADITEHLSFSAFDAWRQSENRRLVLMTTGADLSVYAPVFSPRDILLLGRESAGVPGAVRETADLAVTLPMRPGLRSLNVALSAALGLGEALRQTGGLPEAGKIGAEM